MKLKLKCIPPSVNRYWKPIIINNKPSLCITEEGKEFKNFLGWFAKANKFKVLSGDVKLIYTMRCRLKGRLDLDNTLKAIQDALEGIAYLKDSQIVEIQAKKIRHSGVDEIEIEIKEM